MWYETSKFGTKLQWNETSVVRNLQHLCESCEHVNGYIPYSCNFKSADSLKEKTKTCRYNVSLKIRPNLSQKRNAQSCPAMATSDRQTKP